MRRSAIIKRIRDMEKQRTTSKVPMLFGNNFRDAFVNSMIEHKGNGSKIHKAMLDMGFDVSYKTVHEYIRKILGTYPMTGRPPKYLKSHERRGAV